MLIVFFNSHDPKGIKFIKKLRLGLSHLRKHKFKDSFQDSLNPFCNCSKDIKSTPHYFLHYPTYITEGRTLLSTKENIENNLLDLSEPVLIKTVVFGSNSCDTNPNTNVLNATIEYVLSSKKFELLFQLRQEIFKQRYESVNSVSTVIVICLFFIICRFLFLFSQDFFFRENHYNLRYLVIVSFNLRCSI